jgi:hypothetical protein
MLSPPAATNLSSAIMGVKYVVSMKSFHSIFKLKVTECAEEYGTEQQEESSVLIFCYPGILQL